jgi:glycosyltransferase involved in cell wall biosynthesis
VHDLAFVRHPEHLTAEAQRYYGRIGRAVHHTDAIIAVSRATRDDLVTLVGTDPGRITVVHEAADPRYRPHDGPSPPMTTPLSIAGVCVPTRYFLFVGTIEPRKNLDNLLNAYAAYRQSTPAAHLVIAGAAGWKSESTVTRLKTEPGVMWLGPTTPDDLAVLYRRATALLLPSWDEGFGLPVIEAMASGTPVAVSTAAALVEIAGDAALTAPAGDVRAWAAIMTALAADGERRADLRVRGFSRAGLFSWERAARETAEVYTRTLSAPHHR